ncbi:MAG: cation:proton antiporter [candidate division KSB1 bacterium]|nr:cation:proton antiporter [candidate division KSB1 bacterium]MDZ7366491.1 cation:proton antiporter [candidate division KSB1 bacterium]MDZ7404547.1 cation:proton antiporter [candidate division KSB1 bacterium]
MHDFSLLYELFVVFFSAIIVVLIFHRLNLPHIVGFLFCGVVAGPYGLNLVTRVEGIEMLAEIGVVLLLFTIGLELSLADLKRMRRYVLLGGSLQVISTAGLAFLVARFFDLPAPLAIFLGLLVVHSSTTITMSVLATRQEMDSPHARVILGISLFQDLCTVPMMLITPMLAENAGFQILPIALSLGKALLLVGMVLLLAMFVVPRLLNVLINVRVREILILGIVIICIGTAWLTSSLGLSLALGAFIAGLAISESPYSHQVFAETLPFKDVFNSLFFISVGMLLDLRFLGNHFPLLSFIVFGVLCGKAILGGLVVKLISGSTRLALLVGLAISQVGEFAFVLAKFSLPFQVLNAELYQGFLATTVLTMMATPLLMAAAPRLAQRVPEQIDSSLAKEQQKDAASHFAALRDHTIIVGFGLNGRYLARVLKESSIPYCILELNPQTVREAQKEGEPIGFGDASRLEILRLVNFSAARILVVTVDDIAIGRRIVAVAHQNQPQLYLIVRTKFAAHVEELYQLGANLVIAEEFETATEIFGHVLAEYDLPRNVIEAYIETIRREGAAMIRRPKLLPASLERLRQLLAGNIVDNFLLLENSPAVGKSLAQLDLRNKTGASVIAIVRDHQTLTNPAADFVLAANDLLVVMAAHRGLENVAAMLAGNAEFKTKSINIPRF